MPKLTQKEMTTTTKVVTSEDGTKTFSITRSVPEMEGEHAVFILLYPTRNSRNCFIDDSTNTHLMTHMEELGLKSYTIVNLFATVTQSRLSLRGLQIDEENLIFLKEQIFSKMKREKEKVVIAWGNSHLNSPLVSRSNRYSNSVWELKTYPHKKVLKELVEYEKQRQQKQEAKILVKADNREGYLPSLIN